MRLYTRTGATAVDDPEFGHFDAAPDGSFDLPDPLSDRLHRVHVGKQAQWETDVERQNRLVVEQMERAKDPATLLAAVQQLVQAAQSVTVAPPEPAPAKRAAKRAAPSAE